MWCHLSTGIGLRRSLLFVALGLLFVALTTTLFLANVSLAAQNTTKTVNFQGRLQTSAGAVVPDGHYNMQFKIYQGGTGTAEGNPGGSDEWTETYINNNGTSGVEVKNGFFSVSLGSVNQFGTSVDWDQDTLFLSMNVAGSASACTTFDTAPCVADGEMLPMKRITATPYAINAGAVGGKTIDQLLQNTATLQANTNIALQSASDAEVTAYIQGRTNQTATNLLVKQGSAQTGKALDIQGSSGDSLFNIAADGSLNQGGASNLSGQLNVVANNSSTNNLPVRIAQQGLGDAGIELSVASSSKYSMGVDASDGSFKIASSVAAGGTSNLGTSTVGAGTSTSNYQHGQANKYTASQTGPLMNMSVYMNAVDTFCPNIQLGIYADNGSGTAPGALLGSSTQSAATTGWNTRSLTSIVNVTSGTVYWLGVYTDCDDTIAMTTGTGTRAHKNGATSLTNPFASESTTTGQLSLYATIDTSSGLADSFSTTGTVFNLGATGDATFKNSADSNNAFQVQNSAGTDLLSVNSRITGGTNHASDSGVNNAATFATNWTSFGSASVSRITSDGQESSDSAQVVAGTTASNGIKNKLSVNPLPNTRYRVSVYAKLTAGSAFTDFRIRYSPDQSSTFVTCSNYSTQTVTSGWTQISCDIDTAATTVTNPYVYMVQPSAPASGRTFLIDSLSFTLATSNTSNVQIGSRSGSGTPTLLTLDKASSAPTITDSAALIGSMYYDTTLGKVQCYEADGWGACGSSPDTFITLSPEYTNTVSNGSGIGTMTTDLCSDTLNINDGSAGQPTICGTNETYNFYNWTSTQGTTQTKSLYVTYKLPSTFKTFAAGSTSLMGRTDHANSTVTYQVYRNRSTGLTACGSAVAVSTGSQSTWQTAAAGGSADPSACSFTAGDSIVFKINLTSASNANAYIANLNFTFSNN